MSSLSVTYQISWIYDFVDPVIVEIGFIPVYIPLCSSELNPIEMFQKDLKGQSQKKLLKQSGNSYFKGC